MLTEQNPPWAAWLGVPNWLAHQPVRAWLWSRPVKKASLRGSLRRMALQPVRRGRHGLFPLDLLVFAAAARPDPAQRLAQPGRRIVVHDAGRALGAEHALVHRMVAIALDVANATVFQVNLDAATASAHVAGGMRDPIGTGSMEIKPCCVAIVGHFLTLQHPRERLVSVPRSKKKIILLRRAGSQKLAHMIPLSTCKTVSEITASR
jgi:hypothetical protein